MKMTTQHYQVLSDRVSPLFVHIETLRELYLFNFKIRDINKAILWRLYHLAKMHELYSYQEWDYKDSHIETAMLKILGGKLD